MGLFDFFKKPQSQSDRVAVDPRVAALVQQLTASTWKERFDAATELGALGVRAESAQAALEEAVCDEHNEVCTAAAAALSAIRRALDAR